MRCWFS
ncbi:hypothetical protein CP061683_0353, partial [Chlamydia psittaci 06-1683]